MFSSVVPRHGINFGLSNYVPPPGIILSPIGMMFTRPDFFTGKVLVKVPIGDMTDTLCWGGCLVPRQELNESPGLKPNNK